MNKYLSLFMLLVAHLAQVFAKAITCVCLICPIVSGFSSSKVHPACQQAILRNTCARGLAYALANTIRCKLKRHHIRHNWQEIVRIVNTQKMITTTGYNAVYRVVQVHKCSKPSAKLRELQAALQIRSQPYRIIHHEKSVVHKPPDEKNEEPENRRFSSS